MSKPHPEPLSPQGRARRDRMIEEIIGMAERTHRRRRLRRGATVVFGCLCLMLLLPVFWPQLVGMDDSQRVQQQPSIGFTTSDLGHNRPHGSNPVMVVETDPLVVARYSTNSAARIQKLDDSGLLATLASIHRPAELTSGEKGPRLSGPVTDEDLGL